MRPMHPEAGKPTTSPAGFKRRFKRHLTRNAGRSFPALWLLLWLILWMGAPLLLGGGASPARAQSAEEIYLDPITVTATRTPERLSNVGDSVEVFSQPRIENLIPGDALEFLTEAAGISAPQTTGRGGQASLFLRGSENSFTSIMLDGFKLTYPNGSAYDLSHLSPEWVGATEILKGPQSPLYGSDAAAGVVNLLPDIGKPGEAAAFTARARFGSDATFEEVFKVKGGTKKSGYLATLSRSDTDGHLPNDGYYRTVGTLALDHFFSQAAKLRLIYHVNQNRYDIPGPGHRGYLEPNEYLRNTEQLIGARANIQAASWLEYVPRLSLYLQDTLYEDAADAIDSSDPFFTPAKTETDSSRWNLDNQFNIRLPGARLGANVLRQSVSTFGFEWEEEEISIKDNFTSFGGKRRAASFYAHQQLQFQGGVTLAGGVRWDDFDVGQNDVTGKFSASWRLPLTGTRLRGAVGEGIKRPAFSELLDVYGPGNPNLRSERQKSREVGFDQFLWSPKARLSVTWYENRIDDLIAYSFVPFPGGANYENVREAKITGTEVSLSLIDFHDFTAHMALNTMDTLTVDGGGVDGAPVFVEGEKLLRRPDWWWSGSLVYHPGRMKAALRVSAVSDRQDIDDSVPWPFPRVRNPGFTKVDLAFSLDIVKDGISILDRTGKSRVRDLTVEIKVKNALDEDYEEIYGFESPGIQWFAGVRMIF